MNAEARGPSGEQFEISFGDQRATIVEVGGGLRSYSAGGRELLDGYGADEPIASGRGQVLIPWPNRLEDGSYEFDGRTHQLPLTEPERGNSIHGLVRSELWHVAQRESSRVVLEHVLDPQPGYPFSLEITIDYALSESGLAVGTTATNSGKNACPYGAGQHPYVTVGPSTVDSAMLLAPGRTVLQINERGLPVGSAPVDGTEHDFRRPRPIGAAKLDHAFTDLERGPDGLARVELRDPAARRRAPEPRCRADDLPPERLPDRRGPHPPGAGRHRHERLGHRPRVITGAWAAAGSIRPRRPADPYPQRGARSARPAAGAAC
jgi:aldose 1-epimerase